MMHSFQKFCNSKATNLPITIDPDSVIVEEKYLNILDVTIKDLRGRREVFDEINVVYVENAINNVNLEEIADMDIPDICGSDLRISFCICGQCSHQFGRSS